MNVHGDLKHVENYESQANLTSEQKLWSGSWNLIRKLQLDRARLQYNFAGLSPASKRVAGLLGEEFMRAEDVMCVTMLPMPASKSAQYHKENRPVRLQVTAARFHRDEQGRATAGGGSDHVVFEADGSKHPTQDHPMVRVVDYDPRRGEVAERYGFELFGRTVASSADVDIVAPAAGIFVSDTEIMAGWVVYLLDGLPICRFPAVHSEQIALMVEEAAIVEEGDVLARISGEDAFEYHRTTYTDGKPDLDEHRVLSPLSGDTSVQVDDLYASVYVTSKQRTTLVARFHADDVASGKIELAPEQQICGTGKFERTRDLPKPASRLRLRTGEDWSSLVQDSSDDACVIARLVSPAEYGLAEFYSNGNPVWDRVSFSHDIIPASRYECKAPLRLLSKMLLLAKKLLFTSPSDVTYPKLRAVPDNWPTPYAVFSPSQLDRVAQRGGFQCSPELQEALLVAVSPDGDFTIRFNKGAPGETWNLVECDDEVSAGMNTLYFRREGDDPESGEGLLPVAVPQCAAFHKQISESSQVRQGSLIADWVPRQFYSFAELQSQLGDNFNWLVSEFLRHVAIPREDENFLLPDAYVSCVVQQDQGLVLKQGTGSSPADGVILLTPLGWGSSGRDDQPLFTWSVNGLFYDMTPPHLLPEGTPPATGNKPRRRRKHSSQA